MLSDSVYMRAHNILNRHHRRLLYNQQLHGDKHTITQQSFTQDGNARTDPIGQEASHPCAHIPQSFALSTLSAIPATSTPQQ